MRILNYDILSILGRRISAPSFLFFLSIAIITGQPGVPAFSAEEAPLMDIEKTLSEKLSRGEDLCKSIKTLVSEGYTRETVMHSVKMGHSVCLVIKCALEGKGDLKEVIRGAMDAGTSSDVISRCALEAGAEPEKIREGLGYMPPELQEPAAIETGPGGEPGGGVISPSTF